LNITLHKLYDQLTEAARRVRQCCLSSSLEALMIRRTFLIG